MSKKCIFITFEGIDGSGKTLAQNTVGNELEARGYKVLKVREPGSTGIAEKIRHILMTEELDGKTQLMLFLASRANHRINVLEQRRNEKVVILCDRFIDSSAVYQAHMMGYDKELVAMFNNFVIGDFIPDATLWFDVDVETALYRSHNDEGRVLTVYDKQEKEYFTRASEGYRELHAKHERIKHIDANQSKEFVVRDCMFEIQKLIKSKGW